MDDSPPDPADGYVVNCEAAVYRDGEYLLAERAATEDHAAGMLSLIGGKLEAGGGEPDALRETVRRELREEVGVEVGELVFVTSSTFVSDTDNLVVNVVFLAEYADGTPEPREPEEVASVHWAAPEEFAAFDSLPEFTRGYLEQIEVRREELGW